MWYRGVVCRSPSGEATTGSSIGLVSPAGGEQPIAGIDPKGTPLRVDVVYDDGERRTGVCAALLCARPPPGAAIYEHGDGGSVEDNARAILTRELESLDPRGSGTAVG